MARRKRVYLCAHGNETLNQSIILTPVSPRLSPSLSVDYFCDSGLRGGRVALQDSTPDPETGTRGVCYDLYHNKSSAELRAMAVSAPRGYAICDSASKCTALQCPGFFTSGKWYGTGEHDMMFKGSRVEGMLCKGGRRAAAGDFVQESGDGSPAASRIFGSFYHRTDREGTFFPLASPLNKFTPNYFVQGESEQRLRLC